MNTMGKLMNAWYDLLNGSINYMGNSVNVYKEDAPESESYHYVLIRGEGETSVNNKKSFNNETIVIVDIVTVFENNVDRSVAEDIDDTIDTLLFDNVSTHNLTEQSGMQILNVSIETSVYLSEEDLSNKYYRKVSRYRHRIHQN